MDLIHIAALLIAAYGFAWVLGRSKLTLFGRTLLFAAGQLPAAEYSYPGRLAIPACSWGVALLECPGCLGFHEGWIYAVATGSSWREAAVAGLVVLTTNLLLEAIISHIKE